LAQRLIWCGCKCLHWCWWGVITPTYGVAFMIWLVS